ncbi:uncharacterized protein [Battus philenor]|uniref:uncharacterized protein n=1 Tax=Battus philenor TaxID=42288 RepID=UPI0035D0399C
MDILETILIAIQLTSVLAKRHRSSSEESIENLIYYKDCNHKRKEDATPAPAIRTQPQPPQECKMCCSMCCGDECVHNQHASVMSRQPLINKPPYRQPIPVPQPPLNPRGKRGKIRQLPVIQPPMDGRRNVEFTRQHIRSLISQDQDIRKILKDLVRVTMQKVDLMEMIKARREVNNLNTEENNSNNEYQQ